MEVRRARPGDAAAIADVHTRSWQAAYEHVFGAEALATIDVARRRSAAERMIASDDDAFVAEETGLVVGFAGVGASRDDPADGELYLIYVLPDFWGTGAGSALMREALGALRERGYGQGILWVLDDNPRARRFYEREGWSLDGATKADELLGAAVTEVRYRRAL